MLSICVLGGCNEVAIASIAQITNELSELTLYRLAGQAKWRETFNPSIRVLGGQPLPQLKSEC